MLRILGRTSSINVRKVLWTCHEIGIDYQREDWGRGFQSASSPEFLALNPNALIRRWWTTAWCCGNPTPSAATWPTRAGLATCCPPIRAAAPRWKNGWTGRPPN
ncbi:hypothetical protein JOS77_12390 [Chromobacterium haemolyticum]|nr:hypothetical protein JOS77_12390 [Chromobacterium haemolyticum]